MTRILMHGCNGKMGQVITRLAAADPELAIVAGVDARAQALNDYPVFGDISECDVEADVVSTSQMPRLWTICLTGARKSRCRSSCVPQAFPGNSSREWRRRQGEQRS